MHTQLSPFSSVVWTTANAERSAKLIQKTSYSMHSLPSQMRSHGVFGPETPFGCFQALWSFCCLYLSFVKVLLISWKEKLNYIVSFKNTSAKQKSLQYIMLFSVHNCTPRPRIVKITSVIIYKFLCFSN